MAYNVARFGDPAEFGYNLVLNSEGKSVLTESWYTQGINSLAYIPRNLNVMFLKTFDFVEEFPWFRPNWIGTSLILTTPIFLWLVPRARPEPAAHLRLALDRHGPGVGRHARRYRLDPVRLPTDPRRGADPVADARLGLPTRHLEGGDGGDHHRHRRQCVWHLGDRGPPLRVVLAGVARNDDERDAEQERDTDASSTSTSTRSSPPSSNGTTRNCAASRSSWAAIPPGRGVVSAASYEARAFGVFSAMSVTEAYRRCPHGVFLPVDGRRYQQASRDVMAVLRRFTPQVEPISIDEAFIDVTGSRPLFGEGPEIAAAIKVGDPRRRRAHRIRRGRDHEARRQDRLGSAQARRAGRRPGRRRDGLPGATPHLAAVGRGGEDGHGPRRVRRQDDR